MSLCMRCEKPCTAASLLCDQCRLLLQDPAFHTEFMETNPSHEAVMPAGALLATEFMETNPSHEAVMPAGALLAYDKGRGQEQQQIQFPLTSGAFQASDPERGKSSQGPLTPIPFNETPSDAGLAEDESYPRQNSKAEQSLSQLSDAARLIAEFESNTASSARTPRAPRLSRWHDISADIRRDSTPLPRTAYSTDHGKGQVPGKKLPDIWPWSPEPEIDEPDAWSNSTDPLLARRLPSSSSAEMDSLVNEGARYTDPPKSGYASAMSERIKRYGHLRTLFVGLTILAVLALTIDSVLLSVAFTHNHDTKPRGFLSPALTLSKSVAINGTLVTLHLMNFSPGNKVFLTRDIEEYLRVSKANPMLVGPDGSADIDVTVDSSWDPGSHTLQAEDVSTRYTATATLRIDAAGPTRPAHLQIDATKLDFGDDVQGANTIRYMNLRNSGGGIITWSASSDQPWLLITPGQGTFSTTQKITVAAQRSNLEPGDYTGKITLSSNVGVEQTVAVKMTVYRLPPNAGAVLSIAPAVLTFTAVDGYADPDDQFLQVSNPGSQTLYWTIGTNTAATPVSNSALVVFATDTSWLSTDQNSGTVVPGAISIVRIKAHSQHLLPGNYINTLTFVTSAGHGVYNTPQSVSISLTVQRRCGLTLSSGNLTFNAVSGQDNPGSQALTLTAAASCAAATATPWSASSSAGWLGVTPANGQLKGVASTVTTINVNTTSLKPGTYVGNIAIALPQSAQSVTVTLVIQAPPPPLAPIMAASPLNLNFSTTTGQPTPPGQTVTITNTGTSPLAWQTSIGALASSWLSVTPTGGSVAPGQTGQLTINVNPSGSTPGTYNGQVQLIGVDNKNVPASGSPQNISINFVILPPCSLAQPSASSLAFSATQGMSDPSLQTQVITASGNCSWPVTWSMAMSAPAPWLKLTASTFTLGAGGQTATLAVAPTIALQPPGVYSVQVKISAIDASNLAALGSPQSFTVTLTVLQPCTLQPVSSPLNFTVSQGQMSAVQTVNLSETGNCARPVAWTASGDAGSNKWLLPNSSSGSDTGTGSVLNVSVDATKLAPGNYTGTITISATGSGGVVVQGSALTLAVSLTVTGFPINGTVTACPVIGCATPTPLANAKVNLLDSTGATIATTTADATGAFSFATAFPNGVPNGQYSLSASSPGLIIAAMMSSPSTPITVAGAPVTVNVVTVANPVTP